MENRPETTGAHRSRGWEPVRAPEGHTWSSPTTTMSPAAQKLQAERMPWPGAWQLSEEQGVP